MMNRTISSPPVISHNIPYARGLGKVVFFALKKLKKLDKTVTLLWINCILGITVLYY